MMTDDEIIEVWHRRKSVAQRLRDPYEQQWITNWQAYRAFQNEMPDPQDWWRSNEYIPEIFNSVETVLPRMVMGMFAKPEWFDVNCPHSTIPGHQGINCFDYERMVKSLLMAGTRRMNLFEPAYEGSKYCTIMGHVWWKLRWEQDVQNRMVDVPVFDPYTGQPYGMSSKVVPWLAYDDPRLEWVSNFRVWPDPTGQGEWFIERIDTTLEKLQRINAGAVAAGGKPIYKNLETLEVLPVGNQGKANGPFARTEGYSTRETEIYATEGISSDVLDEGYEGTPVTLEVCVGLVPYEPEDGVLWRRTIIANNTTIIRDDPNPTPDLKPEYFSSKQIPVPGFVYGDSVVRYAEPMNRQLNRLANFRMDEVVLGIWQQYIANANAVKSSQLNLNPGGVIMVDTAADVRTAFAVLERRSVLPESYREEAVSMDRIQRITGATAIQQGSQSADRETATSVGARVQLGSERFRLAVMWQNMTFKRQLLKRMFALYQRHLPPDRLIRIVGTDYQVPLDISMLQDDIDIDIDADIYDIDGPAKHQALAQLMQAAATEPFASWMRPEVVLRDAIEASLNKDGRKYVKSQEEMAAEQQAKIFQAISMASMGLEPDASGGNALATKQMELRKAGKGAGA